MTPALSERLEPLMQKPGWQLTLILSGLLACFMLVLYQCLFRGLWQQQRELEQQINHLRPVVTHAQVVLLRATPLSLLQQTLTENAVTKTQIIPLDQQFAPTLSASQVTLIRWLPVSVQQGEMHLQSSFNALNHFLQALLQRPSPPAFSELNIRTAKNGLAVSFMLTQTAEFSEEKGSVVALTSARDPFADTQSSSCTEEVAYPTWLLGGITDAEGQRFGWLLSPDGQWNKVEAGMQIGAPQWTVQGLGASQVELRISDERCGEQQQFLTFKTNKSSGKMPGKGK